MIAVRLEGRMGNQLFQYAFIYAAAKKLRTRFYIDKNSQVFVLKDYFQIRRGYWKPFDNGNYQIKLFKRHWYDRFYRALRSCYHLNTITFDNGVAPETQLKVITDNTVYAGFFQSEKYFEICSEEIKDNFRIKGKHALRFTKLVRELGLPDAYIAVHIRLGDYRDLNIQLEMDYFHRAIAHVHRESNYYVILSDEPERIKGVFDYLPQKYFSTEPEIIDFQFLTHAETCILSNSSFSWWGAYLNPNSPRVLAPRYWLGRKTKTEYPNGIVRKDFILIN